MVEYFYIKMLAKGVAALPQFSTPQMLKRGYFSVLFVSERFVAGKGELGLVTDRGLGILKFPSL